MLPLVAWYTPAIIAALQLAHRSWLLAASQQYAWLKPETVINAGGRALTVVQRLGGGMQGEVFLVREQGVERALKLFPTSHQHVLGELAALQSKRSTGLRVVADHGILPDLTFPTRGQPYWGVVFDYVRGLSLELFNPRRGRPGLDPRIQAEIWKRLEPQRAAIEKVGYNNVLFDINRAELVIIDPH